MNDIFIHTAYNFTIPTSPHHTHKSQLSVVIITAIPASTKLLLSPAILHVSGGWGQEVTVLMQGVFEGAGEVGGGGGGALDQRRVELNHLLPHCRLH